jgi:phenylpropionate dioxygenase-like ring-hydroxylating dioxygenase large terminal subunit
MTTELDATSLRLPPGSFMDPRIYRSPEVHEIDMNAVLPGAWILVGDVDQLGRPGDFVTERIGYEPVIVVHGRDGRLRAFSNVCTHRASLLAERSGSCGRYLQCPYHGWRFQLDGKLAAVPHQRQMAEPIDPEQLGLHELRLATWERFVFVNVSGDAPPLEEYLAPIPELLRNHGVGELKRSASYVHHVAANWKVLVDNGACDYHVPVVHARLMPLIDGVPTWHEEAVGFTGILRVRLSQEGLASSPLYPGLEGDAADLTYAIGVYPNLLVIAFRTGDLHVLSWWPESIDRTEVRVQAYSHTEHTDDDVRYSAESIEKLQLEDIEVCELVQQGMASASYRPGPRHALEARVEGFQAAYLTALARARAAAPVDDDLLSTPTV